MLRSVGRLVRAFPYEDRLALSVLAFVSLVSCTGATMGALLTEAPYRWLFVAFAAATTLGGLWLGYYGIYATYRLRLGLSETSAALATATELVDETYDSMAKLETLVTNVVEVMGESGIQLAGYHYPWDDD